MNVVINNVFIYHYHMSSYVLGGVLLLGLLAPVILRIFMKKRTHVDTTVILVPVSVFVFIIYVIAFGVQLFTVLLAILIFLVVITNFRALQRYFNGLYVDYYHVPYVIATILSGFAIVFLCFLLVWFAPVNDMDIVITVKDRPAYTETRQTFTGTAYQGFSEKNSVFEKTSAVVTTYTPEEDNERSPVIVFVPDVCVRAADYVPLMKVLALRGYACTAADITSADTALLSFNGTWIRPFIMRVERIMNQKAFNEVKDGYFQKKLLETKAFISLVKKQYPGREIVLAADEEYPLLSREMIEGVRVLRLELDGLGFLPLTHPLDAACIMPDKYTYAGRRTSDRMVYEAANYIIGECR